MESAFWSLAAPVFLGLTFARGFWRAVATGADVTGPINIGNPNEFTIREPAEIVIELTGSQSRIVSARLPSHDPKQRKPDIVMARDVLGCEPKMQLREGLGRTIAYFDKLLSEGETFNAAREGVM